MTIAGLDETRYELYDGAEVRFKLTIGLRTMAGTGKILDVYNAGGTTLLFLDGVDGATGQKVWLHIRAEHIVEVIKLGTLAQMVVDLEKAKPKTEIPEDVKLLIRTMDIRNEEMRINLANIRKKHGI